MVAAQLRLGNRAARLLNHMALERLDEEIPGLPARRYFGGREMAAVALGFRAPENGSPRAHQCVKRAVRELVDKGAIRRVRVGGGGCPAVFELNVHSARPPHPGFRSY